MVRWDTFEPADFEYDFENDKLAAHGVTFEEAVETFFRTFRILRNKKDRNRFQLYGRTMAGRPLEIIFELKPGKIVRIITGWPL
ncbi:MAG: hypothetical protein QOC81_2588 [Thermoanaerobaculia bacterium]|nr:hypothetical protein [Thermoanaerobaculia bacterium]